MEKIITYINTCRQKGFSDGYIRKVLKEAGHQDYIIGKAMSGLLCFLADNKREVAFATLVGGAPMIVGTALFAVDKEMVTWWEVSQPFLTFLLKNN